MSENDYDWLGSGVYFFERGPERAAEWAAGAHDDPCVLRARIRLDSCLDLTDLAGIEALRPYYDLFVESVGPERAATLRQNPGARRLDREVMNFACVALEEQGTPVKVIRQAFQEGDSIWTDPDGRIPHALVYDRTHVQVAVRDHTVIEELTILKSVG